MGAFETFVNANLGIRKPLISDIGHPTGSSKAAGIVGSQYIDSQTNELYEKTGENNSLDWAFVRKLGVASSSNVISAALTIPQGTAEVETTFQELLDIQEINPPPQVAASLNFISEPDNIYQFILHSVSASGFKASLSYNMQESDGYISVFIDPKGAEMISGTARVSPGLSVQWFEEVGANYLRLRETAINSESPAEHLWEITENGDLRPQPYAIETSSDKQYFIHSGDYLIPSDDHLVLNTGNLYIEPTGTVFSVQWFSHSGSNYLQIRDSEEISEDPALEMWEDNNGLIPLNSPVEVNDDTQYFINSGDYVIPSSNSAILNTGDLSS